MAEPKSGRVCTTCDRIEGRVEEIHRLLTGGDEPENGVIIKLDRLGEESKRRKESENRREHWIRLVAAGALGSIGLSLWNLISGHSSGSPPTTGTHP